VLFFEREDMRDKVGTPTYVFPLTSKEKREYFSETAKQQDTIFDIDYWGMNSFKESYHSIFGGIPCPKVILKQLLQRYNTQGIIIPRRS
jgi:hypothetical protein